MQEQRPSAIGTSSGSPAGARQRRAPRWLGRSTAWLASDTALGVTTLNLAAHPLAGGWSLSLFGRVVGGPPAWASLLAWLAVLLLRAHRRAGTGRGTWAAIRRRVRARPDLLLLGVLFTTALALRVWGTGFGLPVITHPDEPDATGLALRMLRDGRLDPRWFYYPTLYMYLLMPLFALRYVSLRGQGLVGPLRQLHDLEPAFYLLARRVSALCGALTVPAVFRLARHTWSGGQGRRAGLVAGTIVAFSFVHARTSHHGVTDALLTLLLTLALTSTMDVLRSGRHRDYLCAGLLTGLAGATKYSAVAMVPVLLAAHLLGRPWRRWLSRGPLLTFSGMAAGFLAGAPFTLMNWPVFVDHLGFLRTISSTMTEPAARFSHMFGYSFESGFGPLLAPVLWASLLAALLRCERRELLLAIHAIAFIGIVTHSEIRVMPRYWLPALPAIAVLVGGYAAAAEQWLRRRWSLRPAVSMAALALIVGGSVAPTAIETVRWDRAQSRPDSRAAAYEWLNASFDEGTLVWSEVWIRGVPRGVRIEWKRELHVRGLRRLQRAGVDVVVLSDEEDARAGQAAQARRRRRLRSALVPLRRFGGGEEGAAGPALTAYLVPRLEGAEEGGEAAASTAGTEAETSSDSDVTEPAGRR